MSSEKPSEKTEKSEKAPASALPEDTRKPEEVLGTVRRNKVFMTRIIAEVVEVVEFVGIDCDGAPIIEGFPSVGLVSVIAGKELVKTLELPLIGIIKSDHFKSSAVIYREQPSYSVRIYGNRKLVVILSEMTTVFPAEAVDPIVQAIFDFAHRHKSPMIYSVEGVPHNEKITLPSGEELELKLNAGGGEDGEEGPGEGPAENIVIDDTVLYKLTKKYEASQKKEGEGEGGSEEPKGKEKEKRIEKDASTPTRRKVGSPRPKKKKTGDEDETEEDDEEQDEEALADKMFGDKIHYVTTDINTAKALRAEGHIPVVDGIIPGVTGGLIAQAPLTEYEVTALLCPSSSLFPDPEAAARVIRVLDKLLPSLDLDPVSATLEKEGEDLKKLTKGLLSGLDLSGLRKSGTVPYGMYQ